MRGRKGFAGQIRDPVTELIVTRRDWATLLKVRVMANVEGSVAAVTEFGYVRGI